MTNPFLSTTNGPSPKQVSITFLCYINVQVLMNAFACTRGQVLNVTLYLVILRQPNVKNMNIINILSEKVGGI